MKNSEQLTSAAAAVTALSTLLCCVPATFAAAVATTSVGLFVADHQGWSSPPRCSLDTLRADFNAHAERVRIVVLLSPT